MSTAHALDNLELSPLDRTFLRVAQDSFPNTDKPASRFGYLSGYMYDESDPSHNYVGGAEKWTSHLEHSRDYKFPHNHLEILEHDSQNMVDMILADSDSDSPLHFTSVASGSAFKDQDIHVVRAFQKALGENFRDCHGLDINADFADDPRKILGEEFPNLHFSSAQHDIYQTPLTQGMTDSLSSRRKISPRRTVAFYSGGTIGNIGLTATELKLGFPIKKIADHLKLQVDYEADESYLIVSHNAQNDPSVVDNYSGEHHARFALHGLNRIQFQLPTTNFNPTLFRYERTFDSELDLVSHSAVSQRTQAFKIGNKDVRVANDDEACRVGHSFQITNTRMGNILHTGGLVRLGFFMSDDQHTIYQVVKASDKLMQDLRKKHSVSPR
jgi:uncharacterized SAM-dependent methyltransferase